VGFNNTETVVGTTCVTGVIEAGVTFKLVTGLKASEVTFTAVGRETVVKWFNTEFTPTLNVVDVLSVITGEYVKKSGVTVEAEIVLFNVTLIEAISREVILLPVICILEPPSVAIIPATLEELAKINNVPALSKLT